MDDRQASTSAVAANLRKIADLMDAGQISDVAYAAVPVGGAALQGLVTPPSSKDALRTALYELAAWAGNDLPNAAMQASDERLAAMEVSHG